MINLAKGKSEENSSFLGLLLVPRILMATMSRQDMPMGATERFFIFMLTSSKFCHSGFCPDFVEARKYRLNELLLIGLSARLMMKLRMRFRERRNNDFFPGQVSDVISYSTICFLRLFPKPIWLRRKILLLLKTVGNNQPRTPFS